MDLGDFASNKWLFDSDGIRMESVVLAFDGAFSAMLVASGGNNVRFAWAVVSLSRASRSFESC